VTGRRKADIAEGRWLNASQVAGLLGVHRNTVMYMGERGELARRRSAGGHWRYEESSVRRYIQADLDRLRVVEAIERGEL
jgi:excisionase family DNA binding protein